MTAPKGPGSGFNAQGLKPHLTLSHGTLAEVGNLLKTLGVHAMITVEEFSAPAAASTTAIQAATATVAGGVTYTIGSGLTDISGTSLATGARNVSLTTGGTTPAHAPATAVITGFDPRGAPQTESLVPATTATTVFGVKAWSKITKVVFGAAGGTDATVSIGFGPVIGLRKKPLPRCGATTAQPPVSENVDHATPTAGSIDTTNATYTPNVAPNGAHNYAVFYEFDPTAAF